LVSLLVSSEEVDFPSELPATSIDGLLHLLSPDQSPPHWVPIGDSLQVAGQEEAVVEVSEEPVQVQYVTLQQLQQVHRQQEEVVPLPVKPLPVRSRPVPLLATPLNRVSVMKPIVKPAQPLPFASVPRVSRTLTRPRPSATITRAQAEAQAGDSTGLFSCSNLSAYASVQAQQPVSLRASLGSELEELRANMSRMQEELDMQRQWREQRETESRRREDSALSFSGVERGG